MYVYLHHKCFSTWFSKVLENCVPSEQILYHNYDPNETDPDYCFRSQVCPGYVNVLFNSNTNHDLCFDSPAIHIVRDPRDLLVSAYFSHLKTHLIRNWYKLEEHRRNLETLGLEDGLLSDLAFCHNFFADLNSWSLAEPNVLHLKGEDILTQQKKMLSVIFSHLGCKIPDEKLMIAMELCSFENLSGGRKVGEVDNNSHFRSGRFGVWKNYFTPKLKSEFRRHYRDLLVKYGYETNDDW